MKVSDRYERCPGEWGYSDPDEDSFRFMLWSGTGIHLPSIDSFLEDEAAGVWNSDDGPENRADLLILREQAFSACKSGNYTLMDSYGRLLYTRAALIGYQWTTDPKVKRDDARQNGTKTPRLPEINDWITNRLIQNSGEKVQDIWRAAQDQGWARDERIGIDRFKKRVTACKKILKKKNASSN